MELYSSEMMLKVIGSFRIHGEQNGDKMDTLDSPKATRAKFASGERWL